VFEDLGGTLPLPTRIALGASDLLTSIFRVFIYVGAGLSIFFFLRWLKTENGQKAMDPVMPKIPVKIGDNLEGRVRALRPHARYAERRGRTDLAGPLIE
jgi:type IV pilus assembly protein PilC